MNEHYLADLLEGYGPFEEVCRTARQKGVIHLTNLGGAARAHVLQALSLRLSRPLLVLEDNERSCARMAEDLSALMGRRVSYFPAREITFYQDMAASREVSNRRLETLSHLLTGETRAVVAPVDALLHRVMPREVFARYVLRLGVGDVMEQEELIAQLLAAGYTREYAVEGRGQFAVRGGILDVFPADAASALRIEFFDNEVDSIRAVDVLTQRSTENLRSAAICPAVEALVPPERQEELIRTLRDILRREQNLLPDSGRDGEDVPEGLGDDVRMPEEGRKNILDVVRRVTTNRSRERYCERMEREISSLEGGAGSRLLEKMIHLVYEGIPASECCILSYMNSPIIVLDEPSNLQERLDVREEEFAHAYTSALERGEAVREQGGLLLSWQEVRPWLEEGCTLMLSSMPREAALLHAAGEIDMGALTLGSYGGRTAEMCREVRRMCREGWRVLFLSGGTARGQRMEKSFAEVEVEAVFDEEARHLPAPGECRIIPIAMSTSFQYPQLRLTVISEADVNARTRKPKASREGSRIDSFTDLEPGDYVVHEIHGIGRYLGITRLRTDKAARDYLQVEYLGGDKVYVPVDHFDRIQKYIGGKEGVPPKLTTLGGRDWQKQKARARDGVKKLAFNLVSLYAAREQNKGHAFSKDTLWQREFEENFPFEETPDQLTATEEIKRDMEREMPMDRLLCGDVGYGKTEVALRAAFKAIMDGYQVAILAPTTVLAQQHYNTILRRFEGFPVHVAVLSRFRTAREQKETIAGLADGSVDLVVGTHRLLSKTISFKKLGLLVIDEEQRFGVGHKETIKNMKHTVDVLTMTATPIPRTLHMSMVGIRDMSLLETPPQARFPVQTYVMEYRDSVIRDAILREMGRGGQVFFLYNHVESLDRAYEQLHNLVPEARIAVGHGQMKEDRLEDIMMDFSEGKYDVLLCTTIIESGLDIPMANTLIIYDADHFGLSQLYQIRGRVGRSNRIAYAYFTIRPGKNLTENAQKRLDTIREFTEFGSGFRIAMRDLEIRGAGNIMGAEQSGQLASIGYDLYCKMLSEAVQELKGEKKANQEIVTRMDVQVNAYLPAEYVKGDPQRLEVYKRIAAISSAAQRDEMEEELLDRFGEEPACVANLVTVAYLKSMCQSLGIDYVKQTDGKIEMRFSRDAEVDGEKLLKSVLSMDRRMTLTGKGAASIIIQDPKISRDEMLNLSVKLMEKLTEKMTRSGK